jgi:hypothetical protein
MIIKASETQEWLSDEEPAATLLDLLIEYGPAEVVEHFRKAARHYAWRPETATTFDRDVSAAVETALGPLAEKIWTGEPIFDSGKEQRRDSKNRKR